MDTPRPLHRLLYITILFKHALIVYYHFFNKNKQQSYNSDDTHHFSLTINKIPGLSRRVGTVNSRKRCTTASINHSSRLVSYYSFPNPLRVGGWVGLSTQ